MWAGALLWASTMSSVYVLNGAMDVKEDRINRSSRPVARGDLTVAQAAGATAILAVLGVTGSFAWVGGVLAVDAAAVLALGWLYSGPPLYLKRWPAGLAAVAVLAGLITYHAGYSIGAADGDNGDVPGLLLFAGVMALWMGLVGQTKDLSDVEGDEKAGRRSGPIAWGENAARLLYSAVALSLAGAYLAWAALGARDDLLPSAVVLVVGASAVAITALGPWGRGGRSARRRPYRAFMLTQYGAHLAVLVW